jgi:hypothetical protein
MPLERAAAVCRATKLLVEQCKRELARLRRSHIEADAFNEAARAFLHAAPWNPPSQFEDPPPAPLSLLPVVRGDDADWGRRAQETRFFAGKVSDANIRRELMAIAQLYDLLGSAGAAASPGTDAMAA